MATRKRPRDVEEYDKYQGLVIYVGNVHYDASPADFEQFLHDNGVSCTLYWPEAGERSHGGWCWARFHHHDDASYAINNLNGAIFCGRKLRTGHVATNSVSPSSNDVSLKMQRANDQGGLANIVRRNVLAFKMGPRPSRTALKSTIIHFDKRIHFRSLKSSRPLTLTLFFKITSR